MHDIQLKRNRRSGGRLARREKRAAPLPDNIKPIAPGMIGGTYKPLSNNDISAIEQTIYQLLDEKDVKPLCFIDLYMKTPRKHNVLLTFACKNA